MRARLPFFVVAALALAGCGQAGSGDSAAIVEAALEGTWQPGEDAGAERAGAVLPFDGSEPHRAVLKGVFRLRPADNRSRVLKIHRTIDRGEGGAFRVVDERILLDPEVAGEGYDEGREAVFDGKEGFAVRRRWGRWMHREVLGGQAQRYLREAYDVAPTLLGAFGSYLTWKPTGDKGDVAGLPVVWEAAALDPAVAPRPLDAEALAALRDHDENWKAWLAATHRPNEVVGRIAYRADGSREVLAGELGVAGDALVEGQKLAFEATLSLKVSALPADARFAIPKDALTARRPRPWKMITDVLGDDLSAVYRRK